MRTYRRITYEDLCYFDTLRKAGANQASIGKALWFSQGTMSWELAWNTGGMDYRFQHAQRSAQSLQQQVGTSLANSRSASVAPSPARCGRTAEARSRSAPGCGPSTGCTSATNGSIGWSGTINGRAVTSGVYKQIVRTRFSRRVTFKPISQISER